MLIKAGLLCAWLDGNLAPDHNQDSLSETELKQAINVQEGNISMQHRADLLKRAEPRICAFDIETTKMPLQFPNSEYDQVSHQSIFNLEWKLRLEHHQPAHLYFSVPCKFHSDCVA